MPFDNVKRLMDRGRAFLAGAEEESPRPTPRETPKRGSDQREGESAKAYELRKAMEATEGGDTRRDRSRY